MESIIVSHIKTFRKIDLPEFFSNINSNQKYNRGTIAEFKDVLYRFDNQECRISGQKVIEWP